MIKSIAKNEIKVDITVKKIKIGAVNWDASLPPESYFGFYQINSLSQAKYREWTPFYADLIDEERITYHARTPEEYEAEMRYAIAAGIDYFAFVWYPTQGSLAHVQTSFSDCSHRVHELNYARHLYRRSNLKTSLGMCAILADHPFTEGDLRELVEEFRQPYYEKINGRPLLYVYSGYREDIIRQIRALASEVRTEMPFVVPLIEGTQDPQMPLADAVSRYAVCVGNVESYAALTEAAIEENRARLTYRKPLIPTFTVGWNPSPRMERLTPWTTLDAGVSRYCSAPYAPPASVEELSAGAERFSEFLSEIASEASLGHVLTFAWNEFEEGGYLCPTYTKSGAINTERVEVFSRIAARFKEALGEGESCQKNS